MTDLFEATNCDRCNATLVGRIMSWFTKETLCIECSAKESKIKDELHAKGYADALEGCGYIPNPNNLKRINA